MPARFDNSARPDNRTAVVVGASCRTAHHPAPARPEYSGLPLPLPLPGLRAAMLDGLQPEMCISCHRRSGVARDTPLRSVVCGPCWFAASGDTSASELVGRPGAPATELPRNIAHWMRVVLSSGWFESRRVDSASKLRALLETLARHADWEELTTWPTWERLLQRTGWSRSTMSAWLAELQRLGFLLRVERGSTPRFRPMALAHVEGNRAAVYQLRLPVDEPPATASAERTEAVTRTPTRSCKQDLLRKHVLPTRARKLINSNVADDQFTGDKDGPTGPSQDGKSSGYFDHRVPVSAAQMLAAAAELRLADRALRRLSSRWVRALIRPWWRAGWTNGDVLHALGHAPGTGGSQPIDRCPAEQLRRPDGWVRHRMRRWWADGRPVPSPGAWERTRLRVESQHGQAAGSRLPYGSSRLQLEDVAVRPAEREEAAAALVRRWARELHERRNAPTPPDQIPDATSRRRHWREVCDQIGQKEADRTQPVAPPAEPPRASNQSVWERALEVARAEGRAARPRRRRRR